jgi:PIF1-like helicase/Helicase
VLTSLERPQGAASENQHASGNNQEDREFAKWQLEVGHGKHTDDDGNIILPQRFHCPQNTVESLVECIYPGITDLPHPHDDYFAERSILSARNDDVDSFNAKVLADFPGEARTYHSADSIKEDSEGDTLMYSVEYLNGINASGLPLSKLILKVGCPIMIMRNLNPSEGVCNGTRAIVTRMTNPVLEVRTLGGDHAGNQVFIPRMDIYPSDTQLPFQLCRRQFPVRLAFAMTINKSQGQSLKYVGLDMRSSVFTHGQFYVAVSRATSVHRLKAIWNSDSDEPVTKNIVYNEVLLD